MRQMGGRFIGVPAIPVRSTPSRLVPWADHDRGAIFGLRRVDRPGPRQLKPCDCLELDLHWLDPPSADSRLVEPHAGVRLAASIERCGQIVPCIVVAVLGDEGVARQRWC